MKRYPLTHRIEGGQIIERGLNQFQAKVYIGRNSACKRICYTKTWINLERAKEDVSQQRLRKGRGLLLMEAATKLGDFINYYLESVHRAGVSENT